MSEFVIRSESSYYKGVTIFVKDFNIGRGKDDSSSEWLSLPSPFEGGRMRVNTRTTASIYLYFGNCPACDINASIRLVKGNVHKNLSMNKRDSTYLGSYDFMKLDEAKQWLNDDGSLLFECLLTTRNLDIERHVHRCTNPFAEAFEAKIGADIELVVEDQVINVAKFVLVNQSPVFKTMFSDTWRDANGDGRVEIVDIEFDTMHSLIKAMYMGYAQFKDPHSALKFFKAADKYQTEQLRQQSVEYIVQRVTNDTVLLALFEGELHKCDAMRESALNFLVSRQCKLITELPGYEKLDRGHFSLIFKKQFEVRHIKV